MCKNFAYRKCEPKYVLKEIGWVRGLQCDKMAGLIGSIWPFVTMKICPLA